MGTQIMLEYVNITIQNQMPLIRPGFIDRKISNLITVPGSAINNVKYGPIKYKYSL